MGGSLWGLLGLACVWAGIRLLSDGLTVHTAPRLCEALRRWAPGTGRSFAAGFGLSALVHSSSATNVIALALLDAGALDLRCALAVVLGANVGTTLTAQMVAWTPAGLAWPVLLGGVLLAGARDAARRDIGRALAGVGGILFGVQVAAAAAGPLLAEGTARRWLAAAENPFLGVLMGALATALIQSSGAFTSTLVGLAQQGVLTLPSALALALGSNVGTVSTTLWASLGVARHARAIALFDLGFNTAGVLFALATFPAWVHWAGHMPGGLDRQLAHMHTLFNAVTAACFFPLL
ncbi:MAG TPA: Na/Pi symporter, partial [Limnochordia bacterium]